jgi:hypothetical protein
MIRKFAHNLQTVMFTPLFLIGTITTFEVATCW